MAKKLDLMAAVYANEDHAQTILDMLQKMHRATNITLADAAMATRDADGKVHIKETREVTAGKGAKRGAIAAGVFGLLFPPSLIASAVVGGAAGGIWGRLRDTGIKTDEIKGIADSLEPGKAAVIALSEPQYVPEIERALQGWDGVLIRHGFSEEETAHLERAAAAADETATAQATDGGASAPTSSATASASTPAAAESTPSSPPAAESAATPPAATDQSAPPPQS